MQHNELEAGSVHPVELAPKADSTVSSSSSLSLSYREAPWKTALAAVGINCRTSFISVKAGDQQQQSVRGKRGSARGSFSGC